MKDRTKLRAIQRSLKFGSDKEFESRSNQAERNHLRWSFAERLPRRCVDVALTDLDGVEDRLFQQQLFRRFQNLEPAIGDDQIRLRDASVKSTDFGISVFCKPAMARPGGDAAFLGSDSQFSCSL
ncbi:hypothetical protein Bca52824_064625 [Brassica carinata]|uniref:Uncharacterized protein n=1 Tax=Brassica carinata TaxID=52824 RepID=A0A8X7QK44_BRACI|nr:hypothetical protein Bca52824_064625 [Brassica carinata]